MLYKSIRWRLQAWHAVLLVFLVAGMLLAFYRYERAERVRAVDDQLQTALTALLPGLTRPLDGPQFDREPPQGPDEDWDRPRRRGGPRAEMAEFVRGPMYYAMWSPSRSLLAHSTNAPAIPAPSRAKPDVRQIYRSRSGFREFAHFGPQDDCVLVGTSLGPVEAGLRRLALVLGGVGLGLTVFGLAGGWWVAGFALRPIHAISQAAREIAAGNRAKRIALQETEGELGQLAEVLNQTFDKLDSAFEQQIRFTADASHELRTPLAVIMTQTQLALLRARDPHEYRETLQTCQRAAGRMATLVNSLLELARVDAGEFELTMEECDLAAVATDALALIAPLAREKGAVLKSAVQPVKTKADPARLSQVVVNLLNNAIQHNAGAVEVSLSLERSGDEVLLRVADNGVGIPAEALPHVFERFYRADKSRSGARNGSGLGLAISQAIVQAHGGSIRAENQNGHGAVFTVSLPAAN
jgi:heavy metal sensor kinase